MTHNEILSILSDVINELDNNNLPLGDDVFEIIQTLKAEWDIKD